jgi:nucleoside-diphosphate-sugar epimerase
MNLFHPGDLVAWIHVENLADMTLLVVTEESAVGETYHAVDGNFSAFECSERIAKALGKTVEIPDRPPMAPRFDNAKIQRLGYRPNRSWDENVAALERMARELQPS